MNKEFTQNPVENIYLARKIDKFTYGLLYPAFFGNMVYDLLQTGTSDQRLKGLNIYIAAAIIIFTAIDYMHLFGDVEYSINEELSKKSWLYILCDIGTSCALFGSFVFVKYEAIGYGLTCFLLAPVLIGLYKRVYKWDDDDRMVMLVLGGSSIIAGAFGLLFFTKNSCGQKIYFLSVIIALLIYYAWYAFSYYPKKMKDFEDKQPKTN